MDVTKNCKLFFKTADEWELFLKRFRDCVFGKTLKEFVDIVNAWKESWFWNDGNLHTLTALNPTPDEVTDGARKEESRLALS